MNSESREFKRIQGEAYVDYTGNEILMFQKIIDISAGGVKIVATELEEIGTEVYVDIHFPELGRKYAYAEGVVVWVREGKMGIKFNKISEQDKAIIEEFVTYQDKKNKK